VFYVLRSCPSTSAGKSSAQETESPIGGSAPAEYKTRIAKKEISVFEGHESDVFVCVWNPKYNLLATG
jgi:hypothetical protein